MHHISMEVAEMLSALRSTLEDPSGAATVAFGQVAVQWCLARERVGKERIEDAGQVGYATPICGANVEPQ